jgi:hypothetical protein
MKKSICIISFSQIYQDSRVLRQIKYLSPHFDLDVIGYGEPPFVGRGTGNIKWHRIDKPTASLKSRFQGLTFLTLGKLKPSFYDDWYWKKRHYFETLKIALACKCDAYHANDWQTLPIAAEAAKQNHGSLIFDAHEYSPLEFGNRLFWSFLNTPLIHYMIRKYIRNAGASMTVAPIIAERYEQEFGSNFLVVMNAPERIRTTSKELNPDKIRLVHHGSAIRDRRLERMIETLAFCDERYSLDFILMDDNVKYIGSLKRCADKLAPGRVVFHPPVVTEEIINRLSDYDVGFYILEDNNFNNQVALPNKFFDFIVAGLAICIGPSPSMGEIVKQYRIGCVAPTFHPKDVAKTLNKLGGTEIAEMKKASQEAAQVLNAEIEMKKVVELYKNLLGGH